jgi:hypothetical protein
MKLVAAMMVGQAETGRYLDETSGALLEFCDLVVMRCEGDAWATHPNIRGFSAQPGSFYEHEGAARQELLEFTLAHEPTHVLNIDADEFVSDGAKLRQACASACPVLAMPLREIWGVDGLAHRVDGHWGAGQAFVWQPSAGSDWRVRDRKLACGRDPEGVRNLIQAGCSEPAGVELLHFGWANRNERQTRYQRYVDHDGGRFHSRTHLDTIMWPDAQVRTLPIPWPAGMPREQLIAKVNR